MRRTPSFRRALAGTALPLVLLAGATACSDDEPATDAASGEATADAEDEAAEEAPEVAEGEPVDPAEFAAMYERGFESLTTAALVSETTAAGTVLSGSGDVDYTTDPPTMALTLSGDAFGADAVELRLVDGSLFLNLGALSNGRFLQLDLDDPNSPLGTGFTDLLDPRGQLELFADGLQEVTFVGEEDVDGVDARRYTMTVDGSVLQEQLDALGAVPGADAGTVPDELVYDVWLDEEDRLVKLVSDVAGAGVEMTLSDFGKEVDVQAPPADEIAPMPGF